MNDGLGQAGHVTPDGPQPRYVSWIVPTLAVAVGWVLSMIVFASVIFGGHEYHVTLYRWIGAGDFQIEIGFFVDALTAMLLLVVSSVGLLVHVYSIGYMNGDRGLWRFFAYLNLFMFSMLLLILGDNFLMLYVGWEAVGLCSYLLIGYWYKKPSAAGAAKKAFVVNRVGDFGFGLGILAIWSALGTLQFEEVFAAIGGLPEWQITMIALLLFAGAVGKSAQFPLHVWLPDAMEGPTPVSALIHAATMVNAGVYMVARANPIFAESPTAMFVVASIGIFTAILAAAIALTQNDIKKVLAYSTVSQLAYMFFALGIGAWVAAIFHLVAHGFFKGLLFMGSGSVIHGASGEQDMRYLGEMRVSMPWTYWTMVVGSLALAGIPIFAGFFSKDEILGTAFNHGWYLYYTVGVIVAFMTAFYTFRMVYMTFHGSWRGPAEAWRHVHESAATMVAPLVILSVPTILAGVLLGLPPEGGAIHTWLEEVFLDAEQSGCRRPAGLVHGHGARDLPAHRPRRPAADGHLDRGGAGHLPGVPLLRPSARGAGTLRGAHPVRLGTGPVCRQREQVLHRRAVPGRVRARRRAAGQGAVVVRRARHRRGGQRRRLALAAHRLHPAPAPDRADPELRPGHRQRAGAGADRLPGDAAMMDFARDLPVLSLIVWTPVIGVLILLLVPGDRHRAIRWIGLLVALVTAGFSLLLLGYQAGGPEFQFREEVEWIPAFGMGYRLGVDGLSVALVILTTVLSVVAILYSWDPIQTRVKEYYAVMLLLMVGMLGVFVSLDLFLFYVFWEISLIPMYLVIGIWGGPRRIYATVKFVIYTLVGSLLMLVAILAVAIAYASAGNDFTFSYEQLRGFPFTDGLQALAFIAFFLAFAIKVPMWPLHTWLPDAHVEAPTAGSIILAGVLLKLGGYGFLRYSLPLLPDAAVEFAPIVIALAVIAILYGAMVSMVQPDLKKLIAYSSVSHMGFVMLGAFVFNVQGLQGAIFQMISHGITTGALFLLVGVIYERTHDRLIAHMGGLNSRLPRYAAIFGLFTFASIGLPGLSGFVGEFLVMLGAFQFNGWVAAAAMIVVIISAVYMLWMFQRVFFTVPSGWMRRWWPSLKDMTRLEWVALAPLIILVVGLGVFPIPVLDLTQAPVDKILEYVAPSTGLTSLSLPW